ncbi:zinc-binding dehydrogenase [Streptomyces sp. NPDC059989]|uniref:zinc-binding dehydrogenase n=1 Tax=Streptomyces sp. NPDC059989 TaxID=3347026 RepID=UPI00367EFCA7
MSFNKQQRALIQQSHQGPKDLRLISDAMHPVAEAGEYLIRVGAAGINFADVMQAKGIYEGGPEAPYVAGFEAAGEIVAVGTDVEDPLPVGTHVVGIGYGAFAQYMVMPAAGVLPTPVGWSDAASLGFVLNWATALAALKPLGDIKAGDAVLVYAAAGGVGQAAVQLARHYGARVIATASPEKHAVVKELGADEVLDSRRPDLVEEILRLTGGVDIVLESVGQATFPTSLAVAKPVTGSIVVFGAASGHATLSTADLLFAHRVQIKGLHIFALAEAEPEIFQDLIAELRALIVAGVYAPGAPQMHSLAEGAEVLALLEAGQTRGKHALDPWL